MSDDSEEYAEIAAMAACATRLEAAAFESAQALTKEFSETDASDITIEGLASAFVAAMIKRYQIGGAPPPSPEELLEGIVNAPWQHTVDMKLEHVTRADKEAVRAARRAARPPPLKGEALHAAALILKMQASANVLQAVLAIDSPIENEAIFLQAVLEGTAQGLLHLISHRVLGEHKRDASPEELVAMAQNLPWPSLVADLIARRTAHKPPTTGN